jgi:hypothetical protein
MVTTALPVGEYAYRDGYDTQGMIGVVVSRLGPHSRRKRITVQSPVLKKKNVTSQLLSTIHDSVRTGIAGRRAIPAARTVRTTR